MSKVFFDTNVLVYANDPNDPQRQAVARNLLRDQSNAGTGVLSTQVLQEFYVVSTAKTGVASLTARKLVAAFRTVFEVITVDPELVDAAIETSILDAVSFWDALIVRTAAAARCQILYTEDLNAGQTIAGVQIRNPFAEGGCL
jgi:predicted nucleic acid-binding protein